MHVIPLLLMLLAPISTETVPEYSRLANGLRLCVIEDHTFPLVSVQMWYKVGSADEPADAQGLTWVLQTYMQHHKRADFRLRAAGLNVTSRTLRDACCFTTTLPPDFLDHVLAIDAERMRAPAPTADDFAAAIRAAALATQDAEARASHDSASGWTLSSLFPDHPYGHPPAFLSGALREFPPELAAEFYGRWFVPGNATLIVYGDVQPPLVADAVRAHFGDIPWAEPPAKMEPELPPAKPAPRRIAGRENAVTIAFRTARMGDAGNPALHVLMHHLCNDADGVLHAALAELAADNPTAPAAATQPAGNQRAATQPAATSPGAWRLTWDQAAWADAGVLTLTVHGPRGSGQGDAESEGEDTRLDAEQKKVEALVIETLETVAASPPDPIALNRARALAASDVRRQRERFDGRAMAWGEMEMIAGDSLRAQYTLPATEGVHAGEVQAAARQLLDAPHAVLYEVGDESNGGASAATDAESLDRPASVNVEASPPPSTLDETIAARVEAMLAAPEPASPAAPPRVDVEQISPAVQAYFCEVPGINAVVVQLLPRGAVRESAGDAVDSPGDGAWRSAACAKYADYLSYHGMAYEHGRMWGPPDHAAQAVELCYRIEQSRPRATPAAKPEQYVLIVAGEFDRDFVVQTVRDLFGAAETAAKPEHLWLEPRETPPASGVTEIDAAMTLTPTPRLRLFSSHAGSIAQFDPILADACEYILGLGARGRPVGLRSAPPSAWRTPPPGTAPLPTLTAPTEADLLRDFDGFLGQLETLGSGAVPREQAEAALRWARTRRLVELNDVESIAEAIRAGQVEPWKLDAHTPADVLAAGKALFGHVQFHLRGPAARSLRQPIEELGQRSKIAVRVSEEPPGIQPAPR